jgi:SAM-dependent methyltransferase
MHTSPKGIRKLLSVPLLYSALQSGVGARRGRTRFVSDHVRPEPRDAILDIGCGTGEILELLQEQSYVGFDPSESYVKAAQARFGQLGQFFVGSVLDPPRLSGAFNLVIAVGVLHHLDDYGAQLLIDLARANLTSGGRFVTLDPALVEGQHPIARALARMDRGRFVRSPPQYEDLVDGQFQSVQVTEHDDYLRIPYTHLAMECR